MGTWNSKSAMRCARRVPAVSYGLAVAERNLSLKAGQNILVLAEQFPSNVYTWREMAKDLGTAASTLSEIPSASLLAGGTNIVDLMKEDVARPDILVDINGLEFSKIEKKGNKRSSRWQG